MRFKRVLLGTKRQVTKFLWFPVTIEDETRWLETATLAQERTLDIKFVPFWNNTRFI